VRAGLELRLREPALNPRGACRAVSGKAGFMPAKSKKQQMAAGAALAAKRGEKSEASLRGASKSMEKSMSEKELHDMASAPRKKLPERDSKG
jgi:hypothetical protein